jgi:Amiloride-sensitive sodium channel
MLHHLKVYCRESSVHGVPNLVDEKSHLAEKLFWAFALVISFFCCGALIFKIGKKVQEDATVTYTSDTAISIKDVSLQVAQFQFGEISISDSICRCDDLFGASKS